MEVVRQEHAAKRNKNEENALGKGNCFEPKFQRTFEPVTGFCFGSNRLRELPGHRRNISTRFGSERLFAVGIFCLN